MAIGAAKQQHQVTVFDDASARTDGSVLLLWPNAMNAAKALGLAAAIAAKGTEVQSTKFRLWDDSTLWDLRVKSFPKRYGTSAVLISREDLIETLRDELQLVSVPIVTATCKGFSSFGSGVSPSVNPSGSSEVYDALIGCDGLNSAIRRQLRGARELRRSCYHHAWIGLSDVTPNQWEYEEGHTVTFLGDGLRFCASTMEEPGAVAGTRRVYWYATEALSESLPARKFVTPQHIDDVINLPEFSDSIVDSDLRNSLKSGVGAAGKELSAKQFLRLFSEADPKGRVFVRQVVFDFFSHLEPKRKLLSEEDLVRLFETKNAKVGLLIEKSRSNSKLPPTPFHIQDRVPVRGWSDGRVLLAGDAAHPSTPDLGQGACQALESAAIFSRCLEESSSFPELFGRFERIRGDRTARITELSRLTAIQSMARGPFVESFREFGIRTALPVITEQEFHSLFSYEF